eukprot:TRINITY_DN2086_c0_g1_i2.p1 TRINITY_DN2086_c0_g1~~TRINITY_DN2086_c0_g1_i2.p1  ORF type:complete len:286 (-),score=43.22 TRINITY_DN2086_c0_g1_i2:55-912(-)
MNETQNTPPSGPAGNEGPAHAKPGAACRFVPLGERGEGYACSEKPESLQDAFLRFKKSKQAAKKHKEAERKDPKRMQALRERFIATCEKYLGVPYAAKYHPNEEDPHHNAPLYLDCCGLIRQVCDDMKEDLGFAIGRWNQTYMYDTLPIKLTEETAKPGDLVFIEAIYNKSTMRPQKHNIVHVEVYLGGTRTIGARWQKKVVEYHDHYAFETKSYRDRKYHFRSIDTWLQGVCESVCPEHPWRLGVSDKRSIFYQPDSPGKPAQAEDDDDDYDCGAPDDDDSDIE